MTPDEIPEDMVVTYDDIKLAGHCASGARRWFESYGLDFRDFLANGISARDLVATEDALAIRTVRLKIERDG